MASSRETDEIWDDETLTPLQKLQKLGEQAPDKPGDLEVCEDETQGTIKPSTLLWHPANAVKYYLTMMYAAQYRGKRILEESYKTKWKQ